MKKLGIKADETVKGVAQFVKKNLPMAGDKLDDAVANTKIKEVDVSPVTGALKSYAKKLKSAGQSTRAEFANQLALNLDFSEGVIRNGTMSIDEAVKTKQFWGKLTFEDPAMKWQKEVYNVGLKAMRGIIHQDKAIAAADETFESLYALQGATNKAMPSVEKAVLKYNQAVEKAYIGAIRTNAVNLVKYEQKLEQTVQGLMRADKAKLGNALRGLVKYTLVYGGARKLLDKI